MSRNNMHPSSHLYEPARDFDVDSEYPGPGSHSPAHRGSEYVRHGFFSKDGWLLEILSSIGSLVLIGGIIAIMWTMDSKPLSTWWFPISINAVISVLTTACTSAMMHNVSTFIVQLKWLYFNMARHQLYNLDRFDEASRGPSGSLIFIFRGPWNLATLGAIITIARLPFASLTQQVLDLQPRNVSMPDDAATFWFAHEYNRELGLPNDFVGAPPDPLLQSAVLQGLYNITTPPLFACAGSCATLKTKDCSGDPQHLVECNMTTPKGLGLSTRHMFTDYHTTFQLNALPTTNDTSVDLPANFPDILDFAVYRSTADHNFQAYNVNVTECALSLTTYEYKNALANGSDFEFASVREIDLGGNAWRRDSDGFTGLVVTNGSKAEGLPQLSMGWLDIKALQAFFTSGAIVSEWVEGSWDNKNPAISAALIGDVDLPRRFEKMATGMTDYLRAGPNKQTARGEKIETEIYVSIRWVWMIGPVAIEAAALVFGVCTIFGNREKCKVPLWKSSALAVLNCKHEEDVGLLSSKVKDIKQMEEVAKRSEVRLE